MFNLISNETEVSKVKKLVGGVISHTRPFFRHARRYCPPGDQDNDVTPEEKKSNY